jgi:DNA-binding NarL/FixJ family response regulator
MKIKVLLADDHTVMRQGIRALLEKQKDIEVVAEASNGREAIEMTKTGCPDVVVMDIGMPDLNGIEATRQILNACSPHTTKVLALSMHADRRFVAGMLAAGASGYMLKDAAFDELAAAIRAVSKGAIYLSPQITDVVVDDYAKRVADGDQSVFSVLSEREREVLQLIAEGQTTKQIATHLHVSVKTIETHRQKVMEKLDVHSVAELTKYAIREGLTDLEH